MCKRIVQAFISEKGMDGIWMDDSGMLAGLVRRGRRNAALENPLRINALWYVALEATGTALRGLGPMGAGVKDPSGDHFERLAGRFRRAFTKDYWCERHQRVCPPEVRQGEDHGDLPDAEQLLFMLLPCSPMARTKQLGVLKQMEERALAPVGLWVRDGKGGVVESLLHRAWLAQALGLLAETAADRQRAVNAARPLEAVWEQAKTTGVHALYRDGAPLGRGPEPLVTAEVLGTLERFLGSVGGARGRNGNRRAKGRGGNKVTGAEKGAPAASSVDLASNGEVYFHGGEDADGVRLFDDSDGACPGRVHSLSGPAAGARREDHSQGDRLGDGGAGALHS